MLYNLPFLLRVLQSIFACVAMACVGAGFNRISPDQGLTTQLGSSEFNFLLLTNYTAWITTGIWAGSFYFLRTPAPERRFALAFDAVFVVFLFAGGIAAAISDYVKACADYNANEAQTIFLNCGTVTAAVAFTFLGMATFIGSLVVTLMPDRFGVAPRDSELPYDESHTPDKLSQPGVRDPSIY